LKKKIGIVIIGVSFLILLAGGGLLFWVLLRTANFEDPVFWIGAAIEVGLAFLVTRIDHYWLRVATVMVAILLSSLAKYIVSLSALSAVILVFLLTLLLIVMYGAYSERKVPAGSSSSRLKFKSSMVIPTYLPQGFRETKAKQYGEGVNLTSEIVYTHDDSEYIIWIVQTKKTSPPFRDIKNIETTEKRINGITVNIEQEVFRPNSKSARSGEIPFIEAFWNYGDINFNLRSDGLSLEEAEKVIASMIR